MTARDSGHDEVALPDMERRQANAIRYGVIFEVDYPKARVRVRSGEIETGWLPWQGVRAQVDSKVRWDAPSIGEQVAVLSPGGDMRQGLVLLGVYRDASPPPTHDPMKDVAEYADGTWIEYDRALHALTVDLKGSMIFADRGMIELTIGGTKLTMTAGKTTLTTPLLEVNALQSTFNSPVTVNGLLTYTAGLTGSGGTGASMTGNLNVTGGTITNNGKNVGSTHTHTGVSVGGGTTGAPT